MPLLKPCLLIPALLGIGACSAVGPLPDRPEYLAARVSRAYDCGVRIDRNRVIAQLEREERSRFVAANAAFAVKSYKAPRSCDAAERMAVQREAIALARR